MLIIKAFHIISMVAWFAGLFYLPRLFVYHADAEDGISLQRFNIMERRLYYGITWPSGILTTLLGLILIGFNPHYYLQAGWMHAKLGLVFLLWMYHLSCGYFRKRFAQNRNRKNALFYRVFNEISILFLVFIVLLVVIKPF
jgi:putative membrane protein